MAADPQAGGDIPRTIGTRIECLSPYPIDLFQVHIPWSLSSVPAQMREMAELVRAGKVRAVGVSNFSAKRMAQAGAALQAEGLPLASNQVRINLLDRSIESNGVLDAARGHGVTLIAYSPLAQGVLTGRFHDDPAPREGAAVGTPFAPERPPAGSSRRTGLERTAPLIAELRAVGEAHGATPGQVALAWLVTYYGDTVVAIPGASRPEQAAEAGGGHGPAADRRRDRPHRPSLGPGHAQVALARCGVALQVLACPHEVAWRLLGRPSHRMMTGLTSGAASADLHCGQPRPSRVP